MTFVFACSKPNESLPYYNTATLTPLWADEQPVTTDTLHRVAAFSLTDQDGNNVSNKTFDGKIYVANFFFTICPSICPKLTTNMKLVADEFAADDRVKFISHSVTPGIDSVERLKKYSETYHIDSKQWHLVTGDKNEIYDLARNSYFAEQEQTNKDFLHTEHFMLIDVKGHLRGIYNGSLPAEMIRLKHDITLLLEES